MAPGELPAADGRDAEDRRARRSDSPHRVTDVRLRIEGLDAENQSVGPTFAWALGGTSHPRQELLRHRDDTGRGVLPDRHPLLPRRRPGPDPLAAAFVQVALELRRRLQDHRARCGNAAQPVEEPEVVDYAVVPR
jgi:hypothetical protein